MHILFLDVDGVLNGLNRGGTKALTRSKLRLLEHIVRSTNCEIVVSSTWRLHPEYRKLLVRKLGYRDIQILSWTPILHKKSRGEEIDLWLKIAQVKGTVVENIAILDDSSDFLPEQLPVFVQTNGFTGMTEEDAEEVIAKLCRLPKLPATIMEKT